MQIASTGSAILEQLDAAVVVTDLAGVISLWNRGAHQLYGWTAEEALGRNVLDLLIPPSGHDSAVAIMSGLVAGEPWEGEFEAARRDGSTVIVHVSDSLVYDESGAPVSIVAISVDVTDRKRVERRLAAQYGVAQALAEAEALEDAAPALLRAISDSGDWAVAVLWRVDEPAGELACVRVWEQTPGAMEAFVRASMATRFAPGSGLPGRVWAGAAPVWIPDVVVDSNSPRAPVADQVGLHGAIGLPILLGDQVLGVIEAFSPRIEQPDDELLRSLAAIGNQIGQFIERKEAENAVRSSEARKQAILEASLDCIVAMNQDGVITEFNPSAERTFGYTRADAVGRKVSELLVPPSLRERHDIGLARYLETGDGPLIGHRVELTGMRKDGTEFPVEIAVTRVELSGPPLFKGAIRDITEQRRVEDERANLLAAERAALEEAETARRRLAFLVEANTLLASSLDFAGAIQSLGRLAVTLLADICLIDVLEPDGSIRRKVAIHADQRMQPLTDQLGGKHAPAPGGPHPAVKVLRTGRSEFSPVMTENFMRETTRDEEHFRITMELGFQSYMCVPLQARGRVLGTITLVSCDPRRRYGQADVALAEDLARRTALTVDNARLYEAEQLARHEAEEEAERTATLQAVTAALAEAMTPEDVADVIVRQATDALRAIAGAVALVSEDKQDLEMVRWVGYQDDRMEPWARFPLASDTPMAEAVRSGRPVFISGEGELVRRYPIFPQGSTTNQSLACVPLVVEGRAVGGMSLSFVDDREFDQRDEQLLVAISWQGAQAIERARAYEAERASRAEAQSAERRLGFLANASGALAASVLDFEATLQSVARLAVPEFADWCVVDLLRDGGIERVALAHSDPEREAFGAALAEQHPPDPQAATGVAFVLRTGHSEIYPEITDDLIESAIPDPEYRETVRGLGLRSLMTVPLIARGRTLGAMTFVLSESDRRYGAADLRLAEDLGRRAALAVDNARLYQERSYVARTLQQTLLPPRLPTIPGVEVGALYRPAGAGAEIGGDFYDLFETADGGWVVAIGDVCGKGAEAAAVIGVVRYSLRAVAMQEHRPSRVLLTVNEALRQQTMNERFCTVAYARLRISDSGLMRATVCCGGHPLPLVLRSDGQIERVGQAGTLLGVFPDPELFDRHTDLGLGDTLIFYTDGVTEERAGDRVFGDEGLHTVLAASVGLDAHGIVGAIGDAVTSFRPDEPRDDMAVVAIRVKE